MEQEEKDYLIEQANDPNVENIGQVSDGYHTFDSLYNQRLYLWAALVKAYKDKAWKTRRHNNGELCFGDGYKNACSFLYSASARAAKALGYNKIITYILQSESGVSLIASGWTLVQENIRGRSWDTPSRRRQASIVNLFGETEKYPQENKKRFEKDL